MEHRKTEKSNLENKRLIFMLLGMVTAMGVIYASFNVKTFVDSAYQFEMTVEEDLVDLPPVTTPPPPPPPPPPPKAQPVEPELEIVEDEIEIPEPDFDMDIDDIEIEDEVSFEEDDGEEEIEDTPMMFVNNMPHFPECAGLKSNMERDQCTRKLFNQKINSCFTVPDIDREMGANGTIAVQFIINTKGEVSSIQILQGMNDRLDKEAERCVKSFPTMVPGKNLDKPVPITYTIPIRVNVQ